MATGENNTTWGDVTNLNLGTALEEAIVGSADVTFASADVTLTLTDTNASQTARNMRLRCTGTTGGSTRNLIVPSIEKPYIVKNDCADSIVVKTTAGTGITVPAGKTMWVYSDATNVVDAVTHLSSLTLGTDLAVSDGGTGASTFTANGVIYGNTTSALLATAAGTTGQVLVGNTGAAPSWATLTSIGVTSFSAGTTGFTPSTATTGAITLAGTLGVANGGTGVTTSTGTGSVVLSSSPTLVTPTLGAASATSIANALGAVGTPSYTFTGDTNTGIYSPAADTIAFVEGGVEAMRIDASGNVGIGTSSPATKLHLLTPSVTAVALRAGNSVSYAEFQVDTSGNSQLVAPGGVQIFNTNGAERMRIDSSGKVGIGTSSPTTKLQITVAPTGTLDDGMRVTDGTRVIQTNITGSTYSYIGIGASETMLYSTGNPLNIVSDGQPIKFIAGTAERMRIDSSGNVGIGTSSPANQLDVVGIISARSNISTGNSPLVAINTNTGSNTTKYTSLLFQGYDTIGTNKNVGLVVSGPSDANYVASYMAFQTRSGDALSERMRIDSSGNVGIGNSVPTAKLHVFGNNGTFGTNSFFGLNGSTSGIAIGNNGTIGLIQGQATALSATAADIGIQVNGGNVGIGTSSPTQKLDVGAGGNVVLTGASTGDQFIKVGASRSGNGFSFIDLQGDTTYSSGLRIIRTNLGANTPSNIEHYGTGALQLITQQAAPILFLTNGTEKMRLDASGNLLVGATATTPYFDGKLNVEGRIHSKVSTVADCMYVWSTPTTGDNTFVAFGTETSYTGRGSITYNRAGGVVAYNTTSDYRAKDILGPVTDIGATIDALKIYNGKMKGATVARPMLVAHEAQEVVPYAVTGEKDAVNEDGTDKYQQMDHQVLIPLLIAELQSLRARVAQLEGN
jgi:hypothetical protein